MPAIPSPLILPYTIVPCQPTAAFPQQIAVSRPQVQTVLEYQGKYLDFVFPSVIDSGADYCMFPAQFGEKIGISIRNGKVQATAGIGDDTAYFHSLRVHVGIAGKLYNFDCYAGFMYSLDRIGVGLLGRHGFFELFESVTFKHTAGIVELLPKGPPEPALPPATA